MRAPELRDLLLCQADQRRAGDLAGQMADLVNAQLNDAGISAATSLLARALIAHGIASVAGAWWADLQDAPEPETAAAIRSIMDDLPPQFLSVCYVDPSIDTGARSA